MGDLLGRWAAILVLINIGLSLFGTCVAQVVASSADAYYITQTIDKRRALQSHSYPGIFIAFLPWNISWGLCTAQATDVPCLFGATWSFL